MPRVKELDSIRGLAALAIVIYHLYWTPFLGTAINLFFVLSGYLITSIILDHPPSRGFLFAFYARRGLRIWPIYYLSLLVLAAINPWLPSPASLESLPQYLTFTQLAGYYWSSTPPPSIPAFGHTWSLAVEEQFYVIWPMLLILLRRRGVAAAAMAVAGLAVAMRTLGFSQWILATNCDGLALGALLASMLNGRTQAEARGLYAGRFRLVGLAAGSYWIGGAVVLGLVPLGWHDGLAPLVGASRVLARNVIYFAVVGLVVAYAGDRRIAVLRNRWLVYLGEISYGIYLYHYIIDVLFNDYITQHGLGGGIGLDLMKVGVGLAVAALSYRLIEVPALSLKRLFPYRAPEDREAGPVRAWIPVAVGGKG